MLIGDEERVGISTRDRIIPTNLILEHTPLSDIPYGYMLMIFYIGFFVFAEAAFIFMAIREYIQDLLRLSDETLLIGSEEAAYMEISEALRRGVRAPKQ